MASPIFCEEFFADNKNSGKLRDKGRLYYAATLTKGALTAPHVPNTNHRARTIDLPPELLMKIFRGTVTLYPFSPFGRDITTVLQIFNIISYTPWILRQVCRQWRHLIVDTPFFWHHARLVFWEDQKIQSSRGKKLVETAINTLSAIFPARGKLSIDLSLPDWTVEVVVMPRSRVMRTITQPFLQRLKSLSTHLVLPEISMFITPSDPTLYELDTLFIELIEGDRPIEVGFDPESPLWPMTTLGIDGGSATLWHLNLLPIAWNKLTHLYFRYGSDEEPFKFSKLLPVLSQSEQLVFCFLGSRVPEYLRESDEDEEDDSDTASEEEYLVAGGITLPRLKTFYWATDNVGHLDFLRTPALEELCILRDCDFPLNSLVSLIRRSSCRIKRFYEGLFSECEGIGPRFDELGFASFTAALSDLEELWTSAVFALDMLRQVGHGFIFPRISAFDCGVDHLMTPQNFVEALSPRLGWKRPEEGDCTRLKKIRWHEDKAEGYPVPETPQITAYIAAQTAQYGVDMKYDNYYDSSDFETFFVRLIPEVIGVLND